MPKLFSPLLIACILCFACKKNDPPQDTIAGQWIWAIQYTNNPAYTYTPQNTGINETLSLDADGRYSITQNTVIVNSGTYKTTILTSPLGERVSAVLYSNSRVTDSAGYYLLLANTDSLMFSSSLMGISGSGARYYLKQK